MARLNILAVCLISVFAFYSTECSTIPEALDSNIEVKAVESLADFLEANPDISVQQLEKETNFDKTTNTATVKYRIGYRISGDRVLATDSDSHEYTTLQNVTLTLSYPKSGDGSVISYLEVIVGQISNLGQAYITAGGIGQRRISVVVEARQTLYFSYRVSIFGY